jgi:NAD+ synthase
MQRESPDVGNIEKDAKSKTMTPKQRATTIVKWIRAYARSAKIDTLVVGVSGGIDSAVVSTLCARTGLNVHAVSMPIRQSTKTHSLSMAHGTWLAEQFPNNVLHKTIELTRTFEQFEKVTADGVYNELAYANSRARLRMMTLYQIAQSQRGIVVGTGNRVEDFGVGFFTKYGDGGVDISPIGDCMKTDVWAMGRELGLLQSIIDAPPTDGLWEDGRTDEDQLGMTYPELEQAMLHDAYSVLPYHVTPREKKNLRRYREIRATNLHKMLPIPVCNFDQSVL